MRIAVITHPTDMRIRSALLGHIRRSHWRYQIDAILLSLRRRGHHVFHTDIDQRFRRADAAILHVDATEMDAATLDLAGRYPVCVNRRVHTIAKRAISTTLIDQTNDWTGPVLVKSNLNCLGGSELRLNRLARDAGKPLPYPGLRRPGPYRIFENMTDVPAAIWDDQTLVVERFLPERVADRYVLRVWNFLGRYERCSWYQGTDPVIKGAGIVAHGPADVPDAIRAARDRLGFDYGKFDFAIGPEGPVLFDVNRTPGFLTSRPDLMMAVATPMAQAFLDHVRNGRHDAVAAVKTASYERS